MREISYTSAIQSIFFLRQSLDPWCSTLPLRSIKNDSLRSLSEEIKIHRTPPFIDPIEDR